MVLEVADIRVSDADGFVAAYGGVRQLVADTPGCRSVRLTRSVESPDRFVLLVEWDSVEAHLENFRASERFAAWRRAIGPFFASPPVVEHVIDVD